VNQLQQNPRAHGALFLTSVTVLLALSVVAGCNQATKAKVSPKACEDYAKRLCTETGETSPTCASIKTATDVMPPEACAAGLANVAFSATKLSEKRKSCVELVTKLCADIGPDTATCTMVKDRTKEFPPERCDEMMKHYPEVVADLKRQEDKNKPLTADKIAMMTNGAVAAFGPTDSRVTIVEFSDFQCPYCSRAATATHQIKEKYGDKIRFVFRQFPLSFHQNAHVAAEASMAANAEGKFWEFHDKLFENQQALDRPSLERVAQELGLNVATFKKALDDKTYAAAVDADLALGGQVAVDGTPTMFLNGKRVLDATSFETLSQQIDAALAGG
jgi:protein-disulfide isomerase